MIEFLTNLLKISLEAAPWLVLGLVIGGLIKSLIPTSLLQKHLSDSGFSSIVKAAVFGAPLPLCSCGVIPAALGLRRAGASKASTVSFLVSTPETGVDSVTVSYALLGPFMAIVRPIAAIVSAITAGLLVGRAGENEPVLESGGESTSCCSSTKEMKKDVATSCCTSKDVKEASCCDSSSEEKKTSCCASETVNKVEAVSSCCSSTDEPKADAEESACCSSNKNDKPLESKNYLQTAWDDIVYTFDDLFRTVIFWLLIGLVFAALVKTFVPMTFLAEWGSGLPAMLIMLVVGIPMYVCATASTPIAAGFLLAGVSPGATMVFLMAGPATNISTLGIIGKELGKRSLIAYLTGVGVVALLTGYIVNYLVDALDINIQAQIGHAHSMIPTWLAYASLLLLVLVAIRVRFFNKT